MIRKGSDFLGQTIDTTVCIVGTGQAGITLAWYLLEQGIDVTLLEGSQPADPDTLNDWVDPNTTYQYNQNDQLYSGLATGQFATNESNFLVLPSREHHASQTKERERIYGGTSTHWGGQSRPLDPVTFEGRPVLNGCDSFAPWPITREDLDCYYAEACCLLNFYGSYYGPNGEPGYNFTADFWAKELNQEVPEMEGFETAMYQFVPNGYKQFQARKFNCRTIGESAARVIVNASLLDIDVQNGHASSLTVGVLEGDRLDPSYKGNFTINAKVCVLACGAVANARQLLLSNVGNPDYVGKYFMCHPIASGGNAVSTSPGYMPLQQRQLLSYQNPNNVSDGKYNISLVAGRLQPNAEAAQQLEVGSCWFGAEGTGNFYHEVLPEKTSAISLGDDRDVFDQRKTVIDWQFSPCSSDNFEALVGLFTNAVHGYNSGWTVNHQKWSDFVDLFQVNGHHLGTTRMSADPDKGVVDANLKVHTVDNLYVAGSSVWASPGISNPTFSIIAFSIRLADHLIEQLNGKKTICD